MGIDGRLRFLLDELRLVRTARGVTQDELARRINWSASTVAMVETGARKPPTGFWPMVDNALQTGGTFERLATELGTPLWKIEWGAAETGAAVLRSYEPLVVPGLLQTEAYARAVLGDAGLLRQEDVERHLAARLKRQEILTRENPPQLFAVLDEGVLRRPVGGPTVMREQLHALVKAAEKPNVWIHVVPWTVGAYPGLNGPFVVAIDSDNQLTGYLDNQLHGGVVDGAEEVAALQLVWGSRSGSGTPTTAVNRPDHEGGGDMDLTGAQWRKSSRSSGNTGDCVEVADNLPGVVGVRDSKDPTGPALIFDPTAWRSFVTDVARRP